MSDSNENDKKKDKRGILRLDISKPRNSSGSVEFRNQPELIGQVRSIHTELSTIMAKKKVKRKVFNRNWVREWFMCHKSWSLHRFSCWWLLKLYFSATQSDANKLRIVSFVPDEHLNVMLPPNIQQ